MYHTPTAYLIIGLLYMFLPAVVWLVLRHQDSKTASLWSLGGGVFAVGMILVAARAHVPLWLTYTVANGLAWVGLSLQVAGLRDALKQSYPLKWVALLVGVWIGVFEYFRVVTQTPDLRFVWASLFYVAMFLQIAYAAWGISKTFGINSGRSMSVVYLLAATALVVRIVRVLLGLAEPDAVAQGIDSILTVFVGLLISVVGSFTFVSMFLERATKRELQDAVARIRQEETARLGEQVAHLERQHTLGAMSYSFAHELSQPLTAILMDTQAIKSSLQSPEKNFQDIANSVDDVERSATRTVELIDRIRNFIRPTSGNYAYVDMKVLVRDVEQLLAHDIRKHHVHFEWHFDDVDCGVHGDRVQLSQIVLNVYRNALQAMLGQSIRIIYVTLERDAHHVILRVRDSGPGLDEVVKDQVGHPFVTTKVDGLGVGLSISNTIAEMHGGSFRIANAVGGGALVELNLPAFEKI